MGHLAGLHSSDSLVSTSGHSNGNPPFRAKKETLFSAKRSSSPVVTQQCCGAGLGRAARDEDPLWFDGFTVLCCLPVCSGLCWSAPRDMFSLPAQLGKCHSWVERKNELPEP